MWVTPVPCKEEIHRCVDGSLGQWLAARNIGGYFEIEKLVDDYVSVER